MLSINRLLLRNWDIKSHSWRGYSKNHFIRDIQPTMRTIPNTLRNWLKIIALMSLSFTLRIIFTTTILWKLRRPKVCSIISRIIWIGQSKFIFKFFPFLNFYFNLDQTHWLIGSEILQNSDKSFPIIFKSVNGSCSHIRNDMR